LRPVCRNIKVRSEYRSTHQEAVPVVGFFVDLVVGFLQGRRGIPESLETALFEMDALAIDIDYNLACLFVQGSSFSNNTMAVVCSIDGR
jgi:hypothetical protein